MYWKGDKTKTQPCWTAFLMSDSRGARTHDPILKRDVLYLLS